MTTHMHNLSEPSLLAYACVDVESFVRGGPTLTLFFLIDVGREDPNTTVSGPSPAH